MTYGEVKTQIRDGTTRALYVFFGEEIEVQNVYVKKIAESAKKVIKRVDTVAEALKYKGEGLLRQSFCFVCRDDTDFQKNEGAWDKVESLLNGNTLIYIATKVDKRSKFFTHFSGIGLNFEPLSEQVLTKHIRERLPLSKESCAELIRVCEQDYGRVLSEVDKVERYTQSEVGASNVDIGFKQLLSDGTIYQPPTDAIFKWVDAILLGKPRLAFKLLQECENIGEPALRLLFVLYQGVRRLLQVQSCTAKDISSNTGLSTWEINLVKDKVGVYRTGELVEALRNIKRLETGIKTGEIDEECAVPFAMVSLLSA